MPRHFSGIDELKSSVGEHIGYSEWHQITQEQVNTFAEATGDHQCLAIVSASFVMLVEVCCQRWL